MVDYANYEKEWWQLYWKNANVDDYKNETTKRQLFFLKQLGDAALQDDELKNVCNFYHFILNFQII